ncbi:MAG: M23 family metallopeptidase [Anaerolineae bacterium]
MRQFFRVVLWVGLAAAIVLAGFVGWVYLNRRTDRISLIRTWFADPPAHQDWLVKGGEYCPDAPMMFPSDGFIGVGWGDGAPPMYEHTGYDIFSPAGADNITPIYAAYDGYLTRESTWRSSVIIRHPDFDQLPEVTGGQEIWTYYTHMASADGETIYVEPDFPKGTREKFVEAGTLLGYQGTWSGRLNDPVGLHLHFSIPVTIDGGGYANETMIENTLNPAPFLGVEEGADGIFRCRAE